LLIFDFLCWYFSMKIGSLNSTRFLLSNEVL
jgi:hypothetical protein